MPYLEVDGAKLYYEVEGEGPALVFIHAGIAHLRMWDAQAVNYASRYRVIRYDTRGFGQSFSEGVEFSNRADLRALLDHLGVDKAVIVGCSRGGQIALDFTLESPERVSALMMVCSGPGGEFPFEPDPDESAFFSNMDAMYERGEFVELVDAEVKAWVIGRLRDDSQVDPALIESFRQMGLDNLKHLDRPQPTAIPLTPPAAGRLDEVRVPVLLITGEYDESYAASAAKHMTGKVANFRHVPMLNTAHVPSAEHPAQFNAILDEFLASLT